MTPPPYFERIRAQAAKRWEQLEQDPELAGPWHQLFRQVQSPRHVLSELLQNADDACATEASVRIESGVFVFAHNGEDFTEEHFASLCKFGYSNKRALHTIGFRGIGFKSTFSLGDDVELYSPSLSVGFNRKRFTEPLWFSAGRPTNGCTEIRIPISDERREREVEKNFEDWRLSPVSLLFFNHIRLIKIGDHELHWGSLGAGPVPDSEWMALHQNPHEAFLAIGSQPQAFPEECLAEIREEHLVEEGSEADFPPSTVEIVMGAKGQLFVVLPTGVETRLPFACNAPFIQDPARLKIKDPETSPTNRWLLERIGRLAGSAMLDWVGQASSSVVERAGAYGLFLDTDREDSSLECACEAIVEEAFERTIDGEAYLLGENGELCSPGRVVALPGELLEIWPPQQITPQIDDAGRPAFCRHVSEKDRAKLVRRGVIEEIGKDHLLRVMQSKALPTPETWARLLKLWAYVSSELTSSRYHRKKENVYIVPVQGLGCLFTSSQVVRLGERRLLQSDRDWEFLSSQLLVLNQNWVRFLAEQRREVDESDNKGSASDVDCAYAVLKALNLEDTSDVSKVVRQVAVDFLRDSSVQLDSFVRLAQIAAKLGATVDSSFCFKTQDLCSRSIEEPLLFDADATLEALFPEDWCSRHILHPAYAKSFSSCTEDEWERWLATGRSGLNTFAPLLERYTTIWGISKIEDELRKRAFEASPYYPYQGDHFEIHDWDFDEGLWRHWKGLAQEHNEVWGHLAQLILRQPERFWAKARSARAVQVAKNGWKSEITRGPLLPAWIIKFRELPCLPDTRGTYHKPPDLLRRTPETEGLLDVEQFVHVRLDNESSRKLLKLLGVRETPTGPDRLLDCLRALSYAENSPTYEVDKWYRRLDQVADACSTKDFSKIKRALHEEKIVLTENAGWVCGSAAFISTDEEAIPGAPVIRAAVRDLALWRKVEIAERPTADLAIQWLNQLPSGQALPEDDAKRVRNLLPRYAVRIWTDCKHWLNLAGEWAPVEELSYALTMNSLFPWSHLHGWVKQKTADLLRLPTDIADKLPFSGLIPLATCIEERLDGRLLPDGQAERRPWLNQLGRDLSRVEFDNHLETDRVRALADRLADTGWQTVDVLETIPYLDGIPAGTPRQAEAIWVDETLCVADRPLARVARAVSLELGRAFLKPEVVDAIKLCFERPPQFVTDYLEENFKLVPPHGAEEASSNGAGQPGLEREGAEEIGESKPSGENQGDIADDGRQRRDNEDDETAPGLTEGPEQSDHQTHIRPSRHRTPRPSILERFASAQGFRKVDDRYIHANGSIITRVHGEPFPWQRQSPAGETIRHYWGKDHCLEQEPLQLDADVWGLIDRFPSAYSLVLSDAQGNPIEVSGAVLRDMRAKGEITLFPAAYRIRKEVK